MNRATMGTLWAMIMMCFIIVLSPVATAATSSGQVLEKISFHRGLNRSLQIYLDFAKPIKKDAIKAFITKSSGKDQLLVFDLGAIKNKAGARERTLRNPHAKSLKVVETQGKLRLKLALKDHVGYDIKTQGKRAVVNVAHELFSSELKKKTILNTKHPKQNWIKHVDFKRRHHGGGQLIVTLGTDKSEVDMTRTGNQLNLNFMATHLPKKQHRDLDLRDFGALLEHVTMRQQDKNVLMQLKLHGHFTHLAYQAKNQFIIDFQPVKEQSQASALKTNFSGEKVTLNFQNIEVRSVLQLLAEFTGLNIVTDDAVQGTITLHLKDVPWDQAFGIVLRMRGLAERQIGNIILVAPASVLANKEQAELQNISKMQKLALLHSELIQINYAKAEDIANLIQTQKNSLLSNRGRISTDARTNTLWVRDVSDKLEDIRQLISKLDVPVRQVAIEARIVSISSTYMQDFGIKFGVTKPETPISGTHFAANELKKGTDVAKVDPNQRFNVSLVPPNAATGSIGLALAKLGHGFMLDLELQAMEKDNRGKIISAPHLITANQHTAKIEKGQEIPFNQATSSGATAVTFKKAVLSLEVTPQITPDKKVTLNLKVHKDSPQTTAGGINGTSVVAIDTNNIETQVQIDDSSTVVIGGIYEQTRENHTTRVPLLSDIPLLGEAFKSKHVSNDRDELLVFITPRIIEQKAFIAH